MKLICTQDNFKKAINNTERVVGKQITLPILENILLETDQGMLRVSATNLEIGVVLKVGAKIEKEGKITIPARLIGNFVANLPSHDTVNLEVKDSTLKITSGDYQAQIKGMGAQEFPIIPESEGDFIFSITTTNFKNAVSRLLPCASVDNSRPELTGVNMLFFEKEIHIAATDSFRLAEAIITIDKEKNYDIFIAKTQSVIIPSQTLVEVLRIADDEEQKIKIAIEEGQIFFQIGGVRIVSRLINGKYPEYKHIIPQKFTTQVLIPKEEFARSVKIASVFTNSKSGEVSITVQSKKVVVESRSVEAGENKTELTAQVNGPEQKIVFNPRYILDGINSVSTNSLDLFLNSGSSPAVIRMVDEKTIKPVENFTYVVMPIKN
jgi:DNA polymerase III subunit beta